MDMSPQEIPQTTKTRWFSISRISNTVLFAALGFVASVAIAFLFLAQPMADDWLRGAPVSKLHLAQLELTGESPSTLASGFAYLKTQYFDWTGRWAGIGLAIFSMAAIDPSYHYWFLLIVLAGTHVVAVHTLFDALLKSHYSRKDIWTTTSLFAVLYWTAVPSPGEVFYWLTGGIENLLSISLSLVVFGVLISAKGNSKMKEDGLVRAGYYLLLPLLAFITTGFHELFGLLLCIALTTGAAIAFRIRHANRWLWLVVLLVAGAGLLFVVVAPGNFLRAQTIHGGRHFAGTILTGSKHLLKSVLSWLLDPKLLCASLLFIFHPKIRSFRPTWLSRAGVPWQLVLPAVWIVMVIIPFYAVVWIKGRAMDERTLSGTYLIFLIGWFANLFVMTRSAQPYDDEGSDRLLQRFVSRVLPVAFACSLVFTGNMRVALSDIQAKRPLAWYHAKRYRDQQIRSAALQGVTNLALNPLPECPHLFFENDFLDSPNTDLRWRNECLAEFYGLKLIWQEPIKQN